MKQQQYKIRVAQLRIIYEHVEKVLGISKSKSCCAFTVIHGFPMKRCLVNPSLIIKLYVQRTDIIASILIA
jgi:hypothetical protein